MVFNPSWKLGDIKPVLSVEWISVWLPQCILKRHNRDFLNPIWSASIMSSCQNVVKKSGDGRVVKSETRTVTRGGVTETTTTEVIETYSSGGTPTRTTRTVTTTSGQKKHGGSSNSGDSSPESGKKNSIHAFMGKLSIKSDKKEHKPDKHSSVKSSDHSKGGRTRHGSSSDSSSDSDDEDFSKECLKQHNLYRSKHGVPSLKLSKSICKYAQEWAEKCAKEDSMRHRDTHKYGENIYMKWSSNPNHKISGKEPVESWYAEIKAHTFGTEPRSMGTGHFTQVVWKGSKEFGVGIAKSRSGKIYVVGNYDPPGNMIGSYASNVPPPK